MPVLTRAQRRAETLASELRRRELDADVANSVYRRSTREDPASADGESSVSSRTTALRSSVASNSTPSGLSSSSFATVRNASAGSSGDAEEDSSECTSSPSVSATLESETRSLDSESTSLDGFVVRDDDPSLAEEATSALRDSADQEIASVLAMIRGGRRSSG